MHIHLDALGGIAGDIFAAAILDAFPEHKEGLLESVSAATQGLHLHCHLEPHNDGIFQGYRFLVDLNHNSGLLPANAADSGHTHEHADNGTNHLDRHHHDELTHHRTWAHVRTNLRDAPLVTPVREHALAIFGLIAEAEAKVHGIDLEHVSFHEVGAWDSLADIVAAAHLIAALEPCQWSVSALPLGSGRVKTMHGIMPVPAPATALLLKGFETFDDGIPGERVTPTGAAILRHICRKLPQQRGGTRILKRSGVGFGTKILPGISNCLRVLAFDLSPAAKSTAINSSAHRDLAVIEFEVDDQSAEELAMGLDRLRANAQIFDVIQLPVFGKKGRMMTSVRVLARVAALNEAVEACFRETTTIGLRHHLVSGSALPREARCVEVGGRVMRVKTVDRPGGPTAKAEADDALMQETHAARAKLRREAESLALKEIEN
jgi:uncharacterized protein (TIGR00299 family) protein